MVGWHCDDVRMKREQICPEVPEVSCREQCNFYRIFLPPTDMDDERVSKLKTSQETFKPKPTRKSFLELLRLLRTTSLCPET